jgi:cell division septation protein DedD
MGARMLAAAMAWLASAAAAAAQPAFPPSLEHDPLLTWLKRETDITPDSVVAVTPQVVTAVVSSFPAGGGQGPRIVIRAEALSAETYERTGALSWHVSLSADCQGRKVRLGETTGYPERNLLGERRMLRGADADWRRPAPGTALENAWRSACDPNFRGPLKDADLPIAQPDSQPAVARGAGSKGGGPKVARKSAPAAAPASRAAIGSTSSASAAALAAGRASGLAVQVGAASSDADAKRLLGSLANRLGGRETWVETAVVDGRTWHRALVGGFADGAEAARFCGQLKAAGQTCFVRSARSG